MERKIIGAVSLVPVAICLLWINRIPTEITLWTWADSVQYPLFYSWIAASAWIKVKMILNQQATWLNKSSFVLFVLMFVFFIIAGIVGEPVKVTMHPLTFMFFAASFLGYLVIDYYDLKYLSPTTEE